MAGNHENDTCDITYTDPEAVARVREKLLGSDTAHELAGLFQVMADPTRLRIVSLLAERELCVCDIAAALEMTQSAVSHQLRVLRMLQLVKFRKEGRMAYYSLDDDHVLKLYTQGLDHLGHISGNGALPAGEC
jgi:ArsR family transcriptional regulator